jgi:hypothetical protein
MEKEIRIIHLHLSRRVMAQPTRNPAAQTVEVIAETTTAARRGRRDLAKRLYKNQQCPMFIPK